MPAGGRKSVMRNDTGIDFGATSGAQSVRFDEETNDVEQEDKAAREDAEIKDLLKAGRKSMNMGLLPCDEIDEVDVNGGVSTVENHPVNSSALQAVSGDTKLTAKRGTKKGPYFKWSPQLDFVLLRECMFILPLFPPVCESVLILQNR